VAVVTGGATGIGRATVFELAKRGYQVVVNHMGQTEEAAHVADDVGGLAFDADVADVSAVVAMMDHVEEQVGPIAVAVCCAGFDHDLSLADSDDGVWDRSLQVMLGGCLNVIAAVSPRMRVRRSGSIVTVSSELALIGDSRHVAYGPPRPQSWGSPGRRRGSWLRPASGSTPSRRARPTRLC
jgi:3-oxoacyl-[acyl-carrier protein] reductase